jgi:NAD(P)-dependent dehydrogenase (short-subunit alcohol dehydrogenase family)
VADEINAAHGAGTAFAFELDVTQEDQWIEVLEKADAAMGGISVLLNNAGVGGDGPMEQMEFDLWKKIMSINVDSVFLGAKHALKYMRAHQPGSIINISSIAGLIANHNSPAYNASKAASGC